MVSIYKVHALWTVFKKLGISTTTAFSCVTKSLKRCLIIKKLLNYLDETYFLLNMKGPWNNKKMPRKPKKQGKPHKRQYL